MSFLSLSKKLLGDNLWASGQLSVKILEREVAEQIGVDKAQDFMDC